MRRARERGRGGCDRCLGEWTVQLRGEHLPSKNKAPRSFSVPRGKSSPDRAFLNGMGTKVWALLPKEGLGDWRNKSGLDKRLERPSKPLPGS